MKYLIYSLLFIALISTGFSHINADDSILPTSLKVTVLDMDKNPVEGASVTLFGNEDDYRAGTGKIQETKETNSKGQVTFKKLKTRQYYVYVVKGELSNISEEVLTNKLLEGRINKVTTTIN